MTAKPVPPRAWSRGFFLRRGISLFEVVISGLLLGVAMTILAQAMSLGANQSNYIYQQAQALQLCQSKLAELSTGLRELKSKDSYSALNADQDWTHLDEDWQYRISVEEDEIPGLYNVQVWVKREKDKLVEVSLAQRIFDPARRGHTADKPPTTTDPSVAPTASSGGN